MELGSYFLFLQEQIKDIIIIVNVCKQGMKKVESSAGAPKDLCFKDLISLRHLSPQTATNAACNHSAGANSKCLCTRRSGFATRLSSHASRASSGPQLVDATPLPAPPLLAAVP
jgi:hypothetical protein